MFKAVLFDLDGTLLDTLQDLANAGNYVLNKMGYPTHEAEKYKAFIGHGIKELVHQMLPQENRNEEIVLKADDMFREYYNRHNMDNTKPYYGIMDLLKKLKENKIKVAVVSNKTHNNVQILVEDIFGDLVQIAQGVNEQVLPKPNPSSLLNAIKLLNEKPSECLYVGDSDVDIITANKISDLSSCAVLWGFRTKKEIEIYNPTYYANNSKELDNIIFKR